MRPSRTTSQAFSNKLILLLLIILNSTTNKANLLAMSRDNLSHLHKSLIINELQMKLFLFMNAHIYYVSKLVSESVATSIKMWQACTEFTYANIMRLREKDYKLLR